MTRAVILGCLVAAALTFLGYRMGRASERLRWTMQAAEQAAEQLRLVIEAAADADWDAEMRRILPALYDDEDDRS